MKVFAWISAGDIIPARWDLRLVGWDLRTCQQRPGLPRLFDGRMAWRAGDWHALPGRARIIAVGVDCPHERTAMLAAGFADALPVGVGIGELAVRFDRMGRCGDLLPRERRAGPLTLDLFHRDARLGERWLALHPREFGLLWHLAGRAGQRVSRRELIAEVWRLRHVPETNTLEVHVSRLRAKLAVVGFA